MVADHARKRDIRRVQERYGASYTRAAVIAGSLPRGAGYALTGDYSAVEAWDAKGFETD
jgi:hypothetical protein